MKWYKKQIDQLKGSKPGLFKKEESTESKKDKHPAYIKKGSTRTVSNPVLQRNRNRPKTDSK